MNGAEGDRALRCRLVADSSEVVLKGTNPASGSVKIQVVNGKWEGMGAWKPTYLEPAQVPSDKGASWIADNWWVFVAGIAGLFLLIIIAYRIMRAERRSSVDVDDLHPHYVTADDGSDTTPIESAGENGEPGSCGEIGIEDLTGNEE